MNGIRLWHTLRLCGIWGAAGRAEYLRKKNVFKSMGNHCLFMPRKVPLYPNLIKLGNHTVIASNVSFNTHDGIHRILDLSFKKYQLREGLGCIEIGNHVFVSANVQIAYNVKIGDNVIITAGSIVSSDIPSNSVARGNPAKVVCTLTQYLDIRAAKNSYPDNMNHKMGKYVGKELEEWLWSDFYNKRRK